MKRLSRNLTAQVLFAVVCGVALGVLDPGLAKQMRPLGDTFVKLVKMVIGPISDSEAAALIAYLRTMR